MIDDSYLIKMLGEECQVAIMNFINSDNVQAKNVIRVKTMDNTKVKSNYEVIMLMKETKDNVR